MTFSIYDASAPVFVSSLQNMRAWLDKAASEQSAGELMEARLADDMRPLPAQYQLSSATSTNAMARLAGVYTPDIHDTESSFAELQERIDRTIAFIESFDREAMKDSEAREVVIKFPNGIGYRWAGAYYLRQYALPNFYFH